MADVQIRFRADSQNAKREINQLTKEIQELRQSLGQTDRTATQAAQVVDRLGDEARESAADVDRLGNELERAGRGTSVFSRGVGGAGREAGVARKAIGLLGSVARDTLTTFGAFAAMDISYAIGRAGVESVRAAGQFHKDMACTAYGFLDHSLKEDCAIMTISIERSI